MTTIIISATIQETKLNAITGELKVFTDESRVHTILERIGDAVGYEDAFDSGIADVAGIRRVNRKIEAIIAKKETGTVGGST